VAMSRTTLLLRSKERDMYVFMSYAHRQTCSCGQGWA
jgi:hypothetical protein